MIHNPNQTRHTGKVVGKSVSAWWKPRPEMSRTAASSKKSLNRIVQSLTAKVQGEVGHSQAPRNLDRDTSEADVIIIDEQRCSDVTSNSHLQSCSVKGAKVQSVICRDKEFGAVTTPVDRLSNQDQRYDKSLNHTFTVSSDVCKGDGDDDDDCVIIIDDEPCQVDIYEEDTVTGDNLKGGTATNAKDTKVAKNCAPRSSTPSTAGRNGSDHATELNIRNRDLIRRLIKRIKDYKHSVTGGEQRLRECLPQKQFNKPTDIETTRESLTGTHGMKIGRETPKASSDLQIVRPYMSGGTEPQPPAPPASAPSSVSMPLQPTPPPVSVLQSCSVKGAKVQSVICRDKDFGAVTTPVDRLSNQDQRFDKSLNHIFTVSSDVCEGDGDDDDDCVIIIDDEPCQVDICEEDTVTGDNLKGGTATNAKDTKVAENCAPRSATPQHQRASIADRIGSDHATELNIRNRDRIRRAIKRIKDYKRSVTGGEQRFRECLPQKHKQTDIETTPESLASAHGIKIGKETPDASSDQRIMRQNMSGDTEPKPPAPPASAPSSVSIPLQPTPPPVSVPRPFLQHPLLKPLPSETSVSCKQSAKPFMDRNNPSGSSHSGDSSGRRDKTKPKYWWLTDEKTYEACAPSSRDSRVKAKARKAHDKKSRKKQKVQRKRTLTKNASPPLKKRKISVEGSSEQEESRTRIVTEAAQTKSEEFDALACTFFKEVARCFSIDADVIERAHDLYRRAKDSKRGKQFSVHKRLAAACVLSASRQEGVPLTFHDVATFLGERRKNVGKYYRELVIMLRLDSSCIGLEDYVRRYSSLLGLTEEDEVKSVCLGEKLSSLKIKRTHMGETNVHRVSIPRAACIGVYLAANYVRSSRNTCLTFEELGKVSGHDPTGLASLFGEVFKTVRVSASPLVVYGLNEYHFLKSIDKPKHEVKRLASGSPESTAPLDRAVDQTRKPPDKAPTVSGSVYSPSSVDSAERPQDEATT